MDLNEEWRKLFESDINNVNDRAMIILIGSTIQERLKTLLLSHLKSSLNGQDKLFSNLGPISNLSSLIEVAYRLRIIDEDIRYIFDKLRKIRNIAAHDTSKFDLNSSNRKSQILEISRRVPRFYKTFNGNDFLFIRMLGIKLIMNLQIAHQAKLDHEVKAKKRCESNVKVKNGDVLVNTYPIDEHPMMLP